MQAETRETLNFVGITAGAVTVATLLWIATFVFSAASLVVGILLGAVALWYVRSPYRWAVLAPLALFVAAEVYLLVGVAVGWN